LKVSGNKTELVNCLLGIEDDQCCGEENIDDLVISLDTLQLGGALLNFYASVPGIKVSFVILNLKIPYPTFCCSANLNASQIAINSIERPVPTTPLF
jgi:hypothetical protein